MRIFYCTLPERQQAASRGDTLTSNRVHSTAARPCTPPRRCAWALAPSLRDGTRQGSCAVLRQLA
eukprot:8622659-Pyramimonas_sp.AAC.1